MKKLIQIMILCSVIVCMAGCSNKKAVEKEIQYYGYEGSEEAEILVENENLELHFDPVTTQFYVVEKSTNTTWYSNPVDAAEDTAADSISKQLLQSQFSLTYANSAGLTTTLNSFAYSVEKGLYNFNKIDNGIEVNYTVGNIERVYCIPYAVPESRMKEFYDKLEKPLQRKIDQYYRKYDINNLRSTDNKDELLAKYPDLDTTNVYVLRDTVQAYLKVQIENIFEDLGYTEEDYEADLAHYGVTSSSDKPVYNVTIQYVLDGNDFVVNVPLEKLAYKADYPIVQLRVLPFFAAGGKKDEGYAFVPDGSGALIRFNNGKSNQISYTNSLYGWDLCLSREAIVSDNKAEFPVFGMNLNDHAMICVIEQGSAYANVEADVSGRGHSYNMVLAQYQIAHGEVMDISSKSNTTIILYESELPKETLKQRYIFCKEPGYVGMAKEYRNYLLEHNPTLVKQTRSDMPVAVELVGAVNKTQHILGIPFDRPWKLTTYKEAKAIVNDLTSLGWKGVTYKLNGWFNDSVNHSVPSSVDLISKLGNKKSLKDLIQTVNDNGGNIYLEADFLYMRDNTIFDGFNVTRDAARYVSRKKVQSYPYSFVWYGERTNWGKLSYLARPAYMLNLIEGYKDDISDYGANNIAFRSLGSALAGDYNERRPVSREASMNMQVEELKKLKEEGKGMMIYTGFSYAVPYADFVTDMPLSDQKFSILDEAVPFYQIALHGLVPYSGRPINLAEDYSTNILNTIESGASLYFSFMKESTAVLQDTKFHRYYANEYDLWKESANEMYQEFNDKFGDLYNQYITNHTILAKDVTVTEYEDGTQVVVNKTQFPYDYQGHVVAARNYIVIKGGN